MEAPRSSVHCKTAAKMGVLMTSLHFPWQGRGAESSAQKALDRSDCCLNHINLHMCTGFGDSGYISGAQTQQHALCYTKGGRNMSFLSAPDYAVSTREKRHPSPHLVFAQVAHPSLICQM